MANVLNTDKQIAIVTVLAEGSSIRAIERMTGVHRDTIMRLGVKVGKGCTAMMDQTMRILPCTRPEIAEIWGYVGKKEKHLLREDNLEYGNIRDNFEAAVGLHFAYCNFVRRHNTIRCTPAMAAGVAPSFWSVEDLLEAAA